MKIYTGGWVADVPEGVDFIEFTSGDKHTRGVITFFDEKGERIGNPDWRIAPPERHWTQRVLSS